MTSKTKQHKSFWGIVHRLTDYSGLAESVVQNIVIYASSLPKNGSDTIERLVFTAQLLRKFNIEDRFMIDRMYHIIGKEEKVSIEDFARLICTFLTENLDLQINFVFSIYDLNSDGLLCVGMDLYNLLHPVAIKMSPDDEDIKDIISDLTNYILKMFNIYHDRSVGIEEFREKVKEDGLLIHVLGRCLPYTHDIDLFKQKLMCLDPRDAMRYFSTERGRSLGDPEMPKKSFYPIDIDCPI